MIARRLRLISSLALALVGAAACAATPDSGGSDDGETSESAVVIQNPQLTNDAAAGTIEPPKADAVLVTPHTPLRSGEGILKKRWVWLPPGTRITMNASGGVDVPVGTTLWKEFSTRIGGRDVLLERREVKKTQDTGSLADWQYRTAHKGIAGEEAAVGGVVTDVRDLGGFALDPARPAPVNTYKWTTTIRVGGEAAFIFPGQRQCVSCHSGMTNMYPGDKAVAAFTLHPASLTKETRAALVAKGYLDEATVTALSASAPKFDTPTPVRALLGELRSNCMTCHSASTDALANLTGFQLDPKRDYTNADLVAALGRPSYEGMPLIENIPLHLEGKRSFMPPPGGGVPTLNGRVDIERKAVLDVFNTWKASAGQ